MQWPEREKKGQGRRSSSKIQLKTGTSGSPHTTVQRATGARETCLRFVVGGVKPPREVFVQRGRANIIGCCAMSNSCNLFVPIWTHSALGG